MKGDANVISSLNDILVGELTAINQYFLHARMCKNWGYTRIAKKIYDESIEEMKHASELTDRILLLEGVPNFQKLDKLHIGENVAEMMSSDLAMEQEAIKRLKAAIEFCYQSHDHATRDLLEKILVNEEEHVDWLEAQLHLIKELGVENYLAQQMHA